MIGVGHIAAWMRRRRAGRRRFNPYIAGTPVFDGTLFFGRESATRRALTALESGNLWVTGERRIGKTSFLHHLGGVLASKKGGRPVFPVFVDLASVTAPGLLLALLEETVDSIGVPGPLRADLGLDATDRRYGAADFARDLRRILDELRSRTGRPSRLVFLFDEVDALVDPHGPGGQWLDPLMDGWSDEVRVVLAGVGRNGHGRLQGLDEIELTPLTKEAAEALVRQPVAGVFDYEAGAVARILESGRLRPYLIQRLCIRSIERARAEGRAVVRESDVDTEAGP